MTAGPIAYLGSEGSFSHQACQSIFPEENHSGFTTFDEVFDAVESDVARAAVIAVENSIGGRVDDPYRRLGKTSLQISAEYIFPINHSLLVSPDFLELIAPDAPRGNGHGDFSEADRKSVREALREVHSHSQPLRQCYQYLRKNLSHAQLRTASDTAAAAKWVRDQKGQPIGAIASKALAGLYDLAIIDENIEDRPDNATRFLVLAKDSLRSSRPTSPALTSIIFQTRHEPGALISALGAFSERGINLTKLETYMANEDRLQPTFYVDVGESYISETMEQAMADFDSRVARWTVLGTYAASPLRGVIAGFLAV